MADDVKERKRSDAALYYVRLVTQTIHVLYFME